MMSERSFGSNGEGKMQPENLCSLNFELDQIAKLRVDGAAIQHETFCIELLRRVTLHNDKDARKIMQDLFSEIVRGWLSQHPRKEEACALENEENYVAEAFASFYLLIIHQQIEFSQLSTALQYLKVSLHSAILKRLRACSRPRAILLPAPCATSEQKVAESTDNVIVWKILQEAHPNAHEQRLAYLLFHTGLSPKEIVNTYPQEFQDIQEISRLRHSIFELLLHRLDQLDDLRGIDKQANTPE